MLAGEAASVLYPSTVHGAYLSGEEAAQRVLDAAAQLPQCGASSGDAAGSSGGGSCVVPPAGVETVAAADCACEWPALLSV